MKYLGAQPDTTTAAERIDTVSTQKGYGDNIINAIRWETNEQLAADEHRQTPKQRFNNAVLERQIAEKKLRNHGVGRTYLAKTRTLLQFHQSFPKLAFNLLYSILFSL